MSSKGVGPHKSGFRATGLVPFNVENVDFSKLLDYSAIAKFKLPDELLAGERVGLLRALDIVESELDDGTLNLFKERYNEDFDVNDEDDENGKLWRIFRNKKNAYHRMATVMIELPFKRFLIKVQRRVM